ncbi:MAG: hypothetical protein GEV03_28575 [Streptosporangiales bacterium]|nr:hypothetical protein [Streptosporangiales bacterium]
MCAGCGGGRGGGPPASAQRHRGIDVRRPGPGGPRRRPVTVWHEDAADVLVEAGVTVAAYVPDKRLSGLLDGLACRNVVMRSLPREEECIAYACGQRIGGGRPVVLMQCSGVGNCLNAYGAFAIPYRIGIPVIMSMRGVLGERNPSQVPMGKAAVRLLETIGVQCISLRRHDQAGEFVRGVLDLAFGAQENAVLVVEPELGGGREDG